MKKTAQPLRLNKVTISNLNAAEMSGVMGGAKPLPTLTNVSCFHCTITSGTFSRVSRCV